MSAAVVRETLFEGKEDYCMIVCEQCLSVNLVQILLLSWTKALDGSKFASKSLSLKPHLSSLICAFGATFQLVASHESTSPSSGFGAQLPLLLQGTYKPFTKPNYPALRPERRLFGTIGREALLEDSNLVDPASSHMLVLKTKPCMSKYKYYTAKLRMAH